MEKEELELINRLKNTKLVEEQAHQHLESAMNDPLHSQTQLNVQQPPGSRKSTRQSQRR